MPETKMHSLSSLADLFKDAKYCKEEICRIRQEIGKKSANERTYDAAFEALGFMLLNCPEEVRCMVEAQMNETQTRMSYAMLRPGYFVNQGN